jgi:Phage capsid family
MDETRTCTTCSVEKDLSEFSPKSADGSKRHAVCRTCRAKAARKITVGKEEATYRKDSPDSFFSDIGNLHRSHAAQDRLERHQREMEARDVHYGAGTDGFIPPAWLAAEWADVARAPRVLADLVQSVDLPPYGEQLQVPHVDTGVAVGVLAHDAAAPTETDLASSVKSYNIELISGMQDIARRSLERSAPGFDFVLFDGFMKASEAKLESQLISGAGSGGEILGVRNVSSIIAQTYTQASPDQQTCITNIAQAASQVAAQRFVNDLVVVLAPRRAAWLSAASGTASLSDQPAFEDFGLNVSFHSDPSIPTSVNTTQDVVLVLDPKSLYLAESDVRFKGNDSGSGNMTTRITYTRYAGFASDLYPKAIAVVSGTGLAAPAGY